MYRETQIYHKDIYIKYRKIIFERSNMVAFKNWEKWQENKNTVTGV